MSLILSGTNGLSDVDGSAATPAIRGTDTNTGIFFPAADTVGIATNGTERARVDSAGNLGLGVTPSNWSGIGASVFEFGASGSALVGNTSVTNLYQNTIYNTSAFRYARSAAASFYRQNAGAHEWHNAPSGTAGNAITFTQAMTLDASSRLMVGSTSAFGAVNGEISVKATSGGAGVAMWDSGVGAKYQLIAGATGANAFGLYDLSASAYRWVVDSSGNLGVGTTSWSTSRLYVLGNTTNYGVTSEAPSGYGAFNLKQTSGNSWSLGMSSNALFFYNGTAGSESMRIDSSGNLLVGITSVPSAGSGGSGFYVDTNGRRGLAMSTTSTAANTLVAFMNPNGTVGSITTSASSTSYATSSDYRLKNTVEPMVGALAKVSALKPCTYKWNADGSDGEGFIAHELAEVVPQAVIGEKDATRIEQYEISPAVAATYDEEGNELTPAVEAVMGEREVPVYQGIDTSFLVATLTAAIQEQQALITQLQADIETLKQKVV